MFNCSLVKSISRSSSKILFVVLFSGFLGTGSSSGSVTRSAADVSVGCSSCVSGG